MTKAVEQFLALTAKHEEPALHGGTELCGDLGCAQSTHNRQHFELEGAADARGEAERLPRRGRELLDAVDHQLNDVVGDLFCLDVGQVPRPGARAAVEAEKPLAVQRHQELIDEEGVASGLVVNEPGERSRRCRRRVQRVRDDGPDGRLVEGAERHVVGAGDRCTNARCGEREGVLRADLVVAKGEDEQERSRQGRIAHRLDQRERRRICPLHVVEEENERRLRARHHAEEAAEHELKAILRFGGTKLPRGLPLAEQCVELWEDIDQHARVGPESRSERLFARDEPLARGGEELIDDRRDRGAQRGVGHTASERLELTAGEEGTGSGDRTVELAHQRRLAGARKTRDEDDGRLTGERHRLERIGQALQLDISAIEVARNLERVAQIGVAQLERSDRAGAAPLGETALQIRVKARCALVSVLRRLGDEREDDRRDHVGSVRGELRRRARRSGDMEVNPLESVTRLEGELSREQLVQRDAHRVEIRTVIDRAVQASGLLGR